MTTVSSSFPKNWSGILRDLVVGIVVAWMAYNWATKNQEKIDLINKVDSKLDITEFRTHEKDNYLDIQELKEVKADKGVMEAKLDAINSSLLRIERKLDKK